MSHENYMLLCVELGKKALLSGNPPVGSILVFENEVIGEGIESGRTTRDVTNHAEIVAIRDAIAKGREKDLLQSILYSTHEPCIMCAYVIRHHKIPQLVYGTEVPEVGGCSSPFNILETERIPKWGKKPSIVSHIAKEACDALTNDFLETLTLNSSKAK